MVNLTNEVFSALTSILGEHNAFLNTAPYTAAYPVCTFSMLASSKINQRFAYFGGSSETFTIQVSIFDDESDCERLLGKQAEIETALRDGDWGDYRVDVRKIGSIGPIEIEEENEKCFQFSHTYEITFLKGVSE